MSASRLLKTRPPTTYRYIFFLMSLIACSLLAQGPYASARLTPDEVFGGSTASLAAIDPPTSSPATPDSAVIPLPFEEAVRVPVPPPLNPQNDPSEGVPPGDVSDIASSPQAVDMSAQAWIITITLATLVCMTLAGCTIVAAVWRHNDQRPPSPSPSSHAEPS